MKLQYKFILIIGLVLFLSYATILYYTSGLQNDLVIGQAHHQARMLHRQLILTREWVSDHQGLFVIKTDRVKENPFLDYPNIEASNGITLVKRNPAMVRFFEARVPKSSGIRPAPSACGQDNPTFSVPPCIVWSRTIRATFSSRAGRGSAPRSGSTSEPAPTGDGRRR